MFSFKDLNPQQEKAVTFEGKPLLILAGAGSGKTRVLTYRAAYFIREKKIDPSQLLLVTFTNKAAEEMRTRLQQLLKSGSHQSPVPSPQLFAGTFHSFCARILRRYASSLDLPHSFVIYDTKDQKQAMKQTLEKAGLDPKIHQPGKILYYISQAKNELISPSEYAALARTSTQETAAKLYPLYQKLLKKYNALDFDDLLMLTVKLLSNHGQVRQDLKQQFRYLLVDEYQDTNRAQYVLTKLLVGESNNLTVVGDASQSIYSWRGADFRNLTLLKNDFPELKVINLERNYRSTQNILDAAYSVISQNSSHPILRLWTKENGGEKIALYEAGSEKKEARFVAQMIKKEKLRTPLDFSYKDFAVLYRTNAQSRVLEEMFMRAGIPYQLVGGVSFYERAEIKDCLAYLKLIANPHDGVSLERAEKIGKRRLSAFLSWRKELPNDLLPTKKLLEDLFRVTGYLERFRNRTTPGVNSLTPEVKSADTSGVVLASGVKTKDFERLENIKELMSVATEFPDLTAFLENVSLVQNGHFPNQPKGKKKKKGVALMTLHSAKGTEFPVVFLVGMEEGLFPHSRSMLSREELEEERRLCYVGITRAKKKLYLTFARRRLFFGNLISNPVSRFVSNISEKLLEYKNTLGV